MDIRRTHKREETAIFSMEAEIKKRKKKGELDVPDAQEHTGSGH